ncbi:uncharacterized protein LOC6597991 isoform X1 [Drosophila persimilis]|uniref:uncharacterized protein LOC6597991 isoform X1 n=1 Tax=Drosophila persimilis TaxID=7234 RepID=UPI000F0884AF|nr:uncharacterized protein LOC6597991 isoform X1 [Drosophila persimilis]
MFINTGKASMVYAVRLPGSGIQNLKRYTAVQPFHTSSKIQNYAAAAALPLPINVDAAETTRFSPQRSRDITCTVMMAQAPISTIDITTDNSSSASLSGSGYQDPHVQSYDCFGSISLNSVMQSNVPTPFGGMHKFSHLNMPGGQWSQEYKFTSQNLHSSHYSSLRDSARADWGSYDQNATLGTSRGVSTRRNYSTHSAPPSSETTPPPASSATKDPPTEAKLTKKEKLKQAFKEYGTTIITFHVGISLISLGGFYLLVSSGINLVPVLEFLGITSTAIAEKVATGSTFVVAYAVHKVFAPARISITLGATPFIVRFLRSKGFLKSKSNST